MSKISLTLDDLGYVSITKEDYMALLNNLVIIPDWPDGSVVKLDFNNLNPVVYDADKELQVAQDKLLAAQDEVNKKTALAAAVPKPTPAQQNPPE